MGTAWNRDGRDGCAARGRELFLAGEPPATGVRTQILASWERCRNLGLSADRVGSPYRDDLDPDGHLLQAAGPVIDRLAALIASTRGSVGLADAEGLVLRRHVGEPRQRTFLDKSQSGPGFSLAERYVGTTGISLVLAERRPGQVLRHEHFAERLQVFSCVAAPVRDPFSGRIVGVLDYACPADDLRPSADAVIRRAARAVEQRMLEQSSERERALLAAFLRANANALAGGPDGLTPLHLSADAVAKTSDLLILQERAEELIAQGRRTAVEVLLSGGVTATLLATPMADPHLGVVVEAYLPSDRERSLTVTRVPGRPASPAAAPVQAASVQAPSVQAPSVQAASTGTASADPAAPGRWPLAVGEPAVGRHAVMARRRLELLSMAGARIGSTLDVTRTAGELTEVSVPAFADLAAVDLYDCVLDGDEPGAAGSLQLRRTALNLSSEHGTLLVGQAGGTRGFFAVGDQIKYLASTPQARCLAEGQVVLIPDLDAAGGWAAQDLARARSVVGSGIHSLITAPLAARGVVLGVVSFYRSVGAGPFEDDDIFLAGELAGRAALSIDNARRYTREHTMATALQRSLLPTGLPEQSALEAAHRYLPAHAGAGGDWFDVIPLPGARVALVVGDVVGHGIHAAATMGRLRTAVHNFASFDLAPDELLSHLDRLVDRIDQEESGTGRDSLVGATCLYAVYDPGSGLCTLASAGHPPPALVLPDGTAAYLDLPTGPPLGLGGHPFETADFVLPEGCQLVLYTDGLVEDRERGIDAGMDALCRVLAVPGRDPERTCQAVIGAMLPSSLRDDDVTVLAVRTRRLPADSIAVWDDVPCDPSAVGRIRAAVERQLAAWDLPESVFTAELVVSELLTNAIRYGTGPIRVRLVRDQRLICEVSDGGSTSPHLRHAATTDEGGRGLFLVAQLTRRWGTRYTPQGKIIWAEL